MQPVQTLDKILYGVLYDPANPAGGGTPTPINLVSGSNGGTPVFVQQDIGSVQGETGVVPYVTQSQDALAIATGVGTPQFWLEAAFPYLFNGTAYDRARSASAATLSGATLPLGVGISARPGNWGVAHTPAVNTQATITKAAGAAGVRHVATSISAVLSIPLGQTLSTVDLNLRDGATGAGTILWSMRFGTLVAGAAQALLVPVNISNLSLIGTAATAMTLEFSGAPGANIFESVSLTGFSSA